jgi:adenosylcobinamide-GDP ribazoletransferase
LIGALKAMFSFFTMLRLDIDSDDFDEMGRSFHLIPLVGAVYGLVVGGTMLIATEELPTVVVAALALLFAHAFNRFLHFDGLMDVGDGLMVAGGREDHLRALKDTNIGAGAVAFALLITLLTVSSLASIEKGMLFILPFCAEVLARNAMVTVAALGRSREGLGGGIVSRTGKASVLYSSSLSMALVALASQAVGLSPLEIDNAIWMVAALSISLMAGWALAAAADRNFGAVNGDVIGAANEFARVVVLIGVLVIL